MNVALALLVAGQLGYGYGSGYNSQQPFVFGGDAGPDSGVHPDAMVDSGVHPDAAPTDSGVHPDAAPPPDAGFFYAAVVTGPSYFHSGGGTPTATYWTDGGSGAYQVIDGGVVEAVDRNGAAASIGAIRAAAGESGSQWVLVDWQQPSTAPWNYDLAALEDNLTAAAAWAADAGVPLCPVGHWDVTGGYYSASQGQPFIDGGAPDASSHYEIVVNGITDRMRTHLTGLADGGSVAASCLTLPYYDLKGPYSGTALDGGLAQAPYSRDFYDVTTTAPLASTSNISVQSDGLHFDLAGHRVAADVLGRTMARAQAGTVQRFAPTAVTPVSPTVLDVTFAVPCRSSGDCVDDPPLLVDTTGIVAQESAGGVATYGLHLWRSGVLQTPPTLSSAVPQACSSPATSCDVRFTFASPPDFDEVSFGDVYCQVFGDAKCTFGPDGEWAGGSNVVSRVNSACNAPVDGGSACIEQPTYNRFSVNPVDAGVVDAGPDAGTVATNAQYLASTSGNYVSVANQGGGTSQCIFAWGTLPTNSLDTIVRPFSNQRGFMGNVGGTWGCAISSSGPTYRVATGSYTTGQRYDVACCFDATGGSGPTDITVYVGGSDVSGTTNGAATTLDSDGVTDFPDNNATTDVDEVVVLPGKTSLSAQDLLDLRCATKAATDASPTSGECASANVDVGHICGLATGTRWYGFEGDATDRCGILDGSETGTPSYTSY